MKWSLIGMFTLLIALPSWGAGDADAGKTKAVTCAACHGADGNAIAPNYPNLAGQNERYLLSQLELIQSGERAAPLMAGQLNGKTQQDLADLAAFYASLPGSVGQVSGEELALGESIYRGGILDKKVTACTSCHTPTGAGNPPAGFPRLSGQSIDYVVAQLTAYRESERTSDEAYGGMMRQVAAHMNDGEIKAVARYIHGLH